MSLRSQILAAPETIADLARAADQRFADGEGLLRSGRYAGSVYLHGLAAEMWLKFACFRIRGASLASPVQAFLAPAAKWMKVNAPLILSESYHSLFFWCEFLLRLRQAGNPLPAQLAGELRHHINHRLFQDWKIELRYRDLSISELHARRVYNDVVWLRHVRDQLWR